MPLGKPVASNDAPMPIASDIRGRGGSSGGGSLSMTGGGPVGIMGASSTCCARAVAPTARKPTTAPSSAANRHDRGALALAMARF